VHNSSVATITRRPVRRLRDRPIVEAGAVLGYGPLFNAGVLHHAGAYHLFVRPCGTATAPVTAPARVLSTTSPTSWSSPPPTVSATSTATSLQAQVSGAR
jgi:hypothetical protein